MSHSWGSRARRLLSRLLRARLRLKVMAGVVVVTLLALAAFDVAVVTALRRYLLTQTDNSLHLALTQTDARLHSLLPDGVPASAWPRRPLKPNVLEPNLAPRPTGLPPASASGLKRPLRPTMSKPRLRPLFGNFEIAFVPRRGSVLILEMPATTVGGDSFIVMRSDVVRSLTEPGAHTVAIGTAGFRFLSAPVAGGSLVVGTSLSQVTKTTGQVELIVTVGSMAVVLLIGLGVFTVVRHGLRPIEAMARQADRITGGDLTGRVATHDPRSEVGRLGTALNGMLARIEASQQQTRRFFGDASHELRTPLASLRANAQLYQQGALQDPGEVEEVMDRIVADTRRMGRLVDDMLSLARLGRQPCQSREPVDLTAVVTGCAQRARVADPTRAWQARIAEGLTVTGDEELLRRAIDNLLMNVLVHTPAGTAGAVSASTAGGCATIEVTDEGPGVPPDDLPHIFERFYRAGPRSGGSGSGLGLAIAAEVASAHGGTVRAAPASPHGFQVTLTLPTRPPDPAPHRSWPPPPPELRHRSRKPASRTVSTVASPE
jgi:two-component system OmpR family sensor kinase